MAGAFQGSAFQNTAYQTDTTTPTPTTSSGKRRGSRPILARDVEGEGHVEFGFTLHATGTVDDDALAIVLL